MKYVLFVVFSAIILNATEYFSKVEPYEKYNISSEVSAKVVFINKDIEYKYIQDKIAILKLDTNDEKIELDNLEKSLVFQKELVDIKEQNYKNKYKVKQLSIYDKNQEKLAWIESEKTLENLKKDIRVKKNTISKKEFYVKDKYVDELFVSQGEYVKAGTHLYTLYDFSKSKLEVFVRAKEINDLEDKEIFVNDKKSEYKIYKITSVRDTQRVSTYKVILAKKNQSTNINFGKVVKVEFR